MGAEGRSRYTAVLFDLDGTLLDTIEDLTASMNAALGELGAPARTVDECKLFVGDGVTSFARRALAEGRRDEATIAQCVERMQRHYAANWRTNTRPYEGIAELLSVLRGRGLAMSVLSNKPDDSTQLMVAHFFGGGTFEVVRGATEGVPNKPDPTTALGIAKRMGVAPAGFVYLGDTSTDMRTANAAGMFAVGATWGFRPRRKLEQGGAKAVIDKPADLLNLLR